MRGNLPFFIHILVPPEFNCYQDVINTCKITNNVNVIDVRKDLLGKSKLNEIFISKVYVHWNYYYSIFMKDQLKVLLLESSVRS